MRRVLILACDLVLIGLAGIAAISLRSNFTYSSVDLGNFLPYLLCSLASGAVVLPALGINRAVWRYTAVGDYIKISAAALLIVAASLAGGFSYSRLEGVARALPILHFLLITVFMVGVRVLLRIQHAPRSESFDPADASALAPCETVLVVGVTSLTDLYLRAAAEFARGRIKIAGLLGHGDHRNGLSIQQHLVLGQPHDIAEVLKRLQIHGVFVDRVVVAMKFERLSAEAQHAIIGLENKGVKVDFLAESLGLAERASHQDVDGGDNLGPDPAFHISPNSARAIAERPYWRVKLLFDFVVAAVLIAATLPLMLVVAAFVALDVGQPVMFWQQRPGRNAQPLKIYKFRTMSAAHDSEGHRIPDSERLSAIGAFLRRTRLDELPQLFSILAGSMSFVGPRPLLPVDQPPEFSTRLMVRPGLTGWAQIWGGREISAADKAALDVWYVHNATLRLDLKILLRTCTVVIFGERANEKKIQRAWQYLSDAGVCRFPHHRQLGGGTAAGNSVSRVA